MRAFKTAFLVNNNKKNAFCPRRAFPHSSLIRRYLKGLYLMNIEAYRPKLHENIELWQNQIESYYCWQQPASGCRSRTVWFFNVIGAHISFREKKFFAVQVQHFCLHPRVGPSVFRKKINQFCIHHTVRNYKGCSVTARFEGVLRGERRRKKTKKQTYFVCRVKSSDGSSSL